MEKEFSEIDSKGEWHILFQQVRSEGQGLNYSFSEARKSQNKNLNRYRDVSPYDHSRVVLHRGTCDYINASLVKMERAQRKYILTQGPLPQTTGHFWLMVWEQNSKAVLMLNRVIEKKQVKCHQYWPIGKQNGGESEIILHDVRLKVEHVSQVSGEHFTIRTLRLTDLDSQESREVLHFHFTTWPDFGVPQSPAAFLSFLLAVRETGGLGQNVGPPVVHCSAGIGRSGTFCLVDSCLVLMDEQGMDAMNVNEVLGVLLEMRKYRMGLIQTPDQLRFSYQAILEGAYKFLKLLEGDHIFSTELQTALNHQNDGDIDGDAEEEPPEPPPRGESLTRSLIEDGLDDESGDINKNPQNPNDNEDMKQNPPDRPLPEVPDMGEEEEEDEEEDEELLCISEDGPSETESFKSLSTPSSSPEMSSEKKSEAELRRRKRQERMEKTTGKIQEIRQKQKQSEKWQERKRSAQQEKTPSGKKPRL